MKRLIICILSFFSSLNAEISQQEIQQIGKLIWKNESKGKIEGLTVWNKGENFASLGIGHFIWFPDGVSVPFHETFPDLARFIQQKGKKVPEWILGYCPWSSRESFQSDFQSPKMVELREWLANSVDEQILFIMQRFEKAMPGVSSQKDKIALLLNSFNGIYAIIDYINFKGEGLSSKERYNGEGWGLMQVLEAMPENVNEHNAVAEFVNASKRVLKRRVENAPSEKNEERWLKGWFARVDTYGT